MKRLTVLITVMAIGVVFVAFSQTESHKKTREEVKQYIDKNVFPLMEKQQAKYISNLSDSEKAELNSLKEKIAERRNEFAGKGQNNKGKTETNQNIRQPKHSMMLEMNNDIKKITDAHPKLNESYKDFIENNKQKWIDDIEAIHEKNEVEQMRNKNDNTGIDVFFTRASNPDWLLLWDPTNPRMVDNMTMRTNNDFKSDRRGSGERNPQLRAEIKSFAVENIVPVIAGERTAFDKALSDSEKKSIETARQKIQVRKIMFKNWYESEDFVAGQRAKDPNFDGIREDMQKSMAEVREIAIAHSTEIKEHTNKIRSHTDEWVKEITTIAENNNQDPEHVLRMIRQQIRKSNTPIAFLLFNPDKTDQTDLFNVVDDVKVIVYPNPVVHSATIAILGAANKNVQVTLFTKGGETLRTLYSGLNKEYRLEVALNTSELSNDIYLVKVVTENMEITRKVVVKR